ncbi:MAG: GTPase-activating protein [Idiomarina sp.]|nr:GTPase-activating protein [Idiomarina sp.]
MTRLKKTRKNGPLAQRSAPKEERQRDAEPKRPHKTKGRAPGSRHSIDPRMAAQAGQSSGTHANQDPRKGSKKPVPLNLPSKDPAVAEVRKQEIQPVEDLNEAMLDELQSLEENEVLQDLLDQIENGETLDADDQAWVDKKLNRYQELVAALGIDVDAEDEDE